MKKRIHEQGQTIIELLIATLVVGTIVTGVAIALSYNIQRNAEVRFREAATNMSQQAMEVIRREREKTSWGDFYSQFADNQTYCINQPLGSSLAELTAEAGQCSDTYAFARTEFQREVAVDKPDDNTMEFVVSVSWHVGMPDEVSISTTHVMKNRLR